jgi:hypothetical protein
VSPVSDVVAALRLTTAALARLRGARAGRVHSAYARTVNVVLEGPAGEAWISLHGPGPVPAPFGIACAALPEPGGLAGAPVRAGGGRLAIGPRLRLVLGGAVVVDAALPAGTPVPAPWPVPPAPVGLAAAVAAVLAGASPPGETLARLAVPALRRLRAATAAADAGACVAAARPLVGLGPGLTPSGDDLLAGWLAGLRAGPARARALARRAGPGVLAAARTRTGAISRAFLAAAAAGLAGEPLRGFAMRPDAAAAAAVLGWGATSGADLLAGYRLAREALG